MILFDEHTQTLTVNPEGELDQHMAERIRNKIDSEILKSNAKMLIIDMSEIPFMDSSGIGMLIGRYKLMKRLNGQVRVRGMRGNVEKIFRMSGLNQIIVNEEGV